MKKSTGPPSISAKEERMQALALFAAIAVGIIAFSFAAWSQQGFDPQAAGLGLNTRSFTASWDGRKISGREIDSLIPAFTNYRSAGHSVVLWLGASQLHAINNATPDDVLAVEHATRRAVKHVSNRRYLQLSQGNGGLQDLLGFYLVARQRGIQPDAIIVALTYDDLREVNLKSVIFNQLDPDTAPNLGLAAIDRIVAVKRALNSKDDVTAPITRTATKGTPQAQLEDWLVDQLEAYWPGYAHRAALLGRSEVYLHSRIAMALGGLMQRRVPPVPDGARARNLEALVAFVELCQSDGVKLFVYKPPHRPGESPFYHIRDRYDTLFELIAEQGAKGRFTFTDFELLVPAEYWGLTNEGRPDVFHFSGFGHERLGIAVDSWLEAEGL